MRICVAVAQKTVSDALMTAELVAPLADVIEIRLDYLQKVDVAAFSLAIKKPLLFTNRPAWEGGRCQTDEDARITPLLEAVEQKAAYIDLELMAPDVSHNRLQSEIRSRETNLILSWHNFKETPTRTELVDNLTMMQDKGADVGKIVTMAHDHHDVLRVLGLQEDAARKNFPLIAFCMGKPGVISRLATAELGGYMTYCSVDGREGTAAGQLTVGTLREILALLYRE